MSASYDESSLNFAQDAPNGTTTNFYLLMGDNAYGYSFTSPDYDAYRIVVNFGHKYTAVVSNSTPYGNSLSANTNLLLVNRYGTAILEGIDYGAYSGLSFTASDTLYYIVSYSAGAGYYGIRVDNTTITESNGIGETIYAGNTYYAALDYASDSDHFFFTGIAGRTYTINLVSNVADLFLKLVNTNTGVVLGTTATSGGKYTFTPTYSGSYELAISSDSYVSVGSYSLTASEVDTTPPTISLSSSLTSLSAGKTATITFNLSESSTSFAVGDVVVTGGVLSNFTGSGATYTAVFTPNANSTANGVINVASGVFSDNSGNVNADGSDANNTVTVQVNTIASPTNPVITTEKHDLSVIVDRGILSVGAVLLKGLTETITFSDGVITSQLVEYAGITFDYAQIDSLITTVTRDSNFTAEFTKEINAYLNADANISYSTAVGLVGVANIDGIILMVAGADGNYVG